VCTEVVAPAPDAGGNASAAAELAARIASGLDVTGVLAVELFETVDGRLLVNELAMRPHNSGHWTIDGAVTSQFEQHLRAVLDLPLGDASARAPWSVMVNVLGGPAGATMLDRFPAALAAEAAVKFHSYGKASRPGRKVGHVTATGNDLDEVRRNARAAAAFFQN
jgi:5-(carboxyamino)imidazole ribonucleotide synthase